MILGDTLTGISDIPFRLIVRWTEKIGALQIASLSQFSMGIGGRRDRGDEQDIEPVIHIPVNAFKILTNIGEAA